MFTGDLGIDGIREDVSDGVGNRAKPEMVQAVGTWGATAAGWCQGGARAGIGASGGSYTIVNESPERFLVAVIPLDPPEAIHEGSDRSSAVAGRGRRKILDIWWVLGVLAVGMCQGVEFRELGGTFHFDAAAARVLCVDEEHGLAHAECGEGYISGSKEPTAGGM